MAFDIIIEYIEKKVNVKFYKYKNLYYFISKEGKIILFFSYKCLNDIEIFIDTLDMDDFYEEFNEFLSEKDKEPCINFKSFLWDLYIIGLNCGKKNSITNEEKFNLEKDRFIARKIIIDFINEDIISTINEKETKVINEALKNMITKIKMIIEPEEQLDEFIIENTTLDDDINTLLQDILKDENLKKRIDKINNNNNKLPLKDKFLNYLNYISNTENYLNEED